MNSSANFQRAIKVGMAMSFLSVCLSACGKKAANSDSLNTLSVNSEEAMTESVVNSVSSAMDEQSNESLTANRERTKSGNLLGLMFQQAYALICERAYQQACQGGVKTVTYDRCTMGLSSVEVSGSVSLNYSAANCEMLADGDSVIRTHDLQFEGPRGGLLSSSSASRLDYKSEQFGGGAQLTRTSAGWDFDVLGKHFNLVVRGKEIFNVSVRTLSPLKVTGGLSRHDRKVTDGSLEINHNLAKYTAVWTASNLQYQSNCCYPVAGSISAVFSGSKTGSAQINFSGCGQAEKLQDGQSVPLQFSSCQ